MDDFFKWLREVFFSYILGGFGGFIIDNIQIWVGLLGIATLIYVPWEIFFNDEPGKFNRILTRVTGAVGGVFSAIKLQQNS
jgi:hypothetical protein